MTYKVMISGGVAMPRLLLMDGARDVAHAQSLVELCAEGLGRQFWFAAVYDESGACVKEWTIEREVRLL